MQDIIDEVVSLKNSEIGNRVQNRIQDFKELRKKSNDELFRELCFCILTANFNAEKTMNIQKEIGECFLTDSEEI